MEALKDPLGDRIIKTVPLPPHKPLGLRHIYGKNLIYSSIQIRG